MAVITPAIPSLVSFIPDTVAVYTQNYIQVFKNGRPIKAAIKPSSRLMEHPLETGQTIIDHRVVFPTEIELTLILIREDYYNTYQIIKQLYDAATLLIVQTKSSIYSNQVIYELPHEETPDFFNTFQIVLRLREVLFAPQSVDIVVPRNPIDLATVSRGNVQPQPLPASINPAIRIIGG